MRRSVDFIAVLSVDYSVGVWLFWLNVDYGAVLLLRLSVVCGVGGAWSRLCGVILFEFFIQRIDHR